MTLAVLLEDEHVLVVEKPGNLVCHSPSRPEHTSLAEQLRAHGIAIPRLINRLDRETSGIVIVAKTERAAKNLGKQVLRREIAKEYVAICWGELPQDAGTIDQPIGVTTGGPVYTKRVIDPAGKPSVTEFTVEQRFSRSRPEGRSHNEAQLVGAPFRTRFSVVRLRPKTGRAHQLRVHLAWLGHPIVGDKIYGPDEQWYLEFIQHGVTDAMLAQLLMPRHALHATAVTFRHPDTQEPVRVNAPLPEDMAQFIAGWS